MPEDDKKDQVQQEEKKEDDNVIVLQVEMDCEGCKARVKKALKEITSADSASFEVDMKGQKVTVKGMKMDPFKACEAVKKKSGKRTVLIHPDPKKLEEEQLLRQKKKAAEEAEAPKKEQAPPPPDPEVVVVLRVHMHCGACAKQIRRNLLKMDGVTDVKDEFASGTVTVTGKRIDPAHVCERVRKRSGKRCEIVPPPPPADKKDADAQKPSEDAKKEAAEQQTDKPAQKKEEKKEDNTQEKKEETKGKEKEGAATPPATEESNNAEIKKYEYIAYRSIPGYVYPPQLFSDENPNACSIM